MSYYKTATVTTADLSITVDLTLTGDWKARNTSDHNKLCGMDGALTTALNRALDADDGIGTSRNGIIKVAASA